MKMSSNARGTAVILLLVASCATSQGGERSPPPRATARDYAPLAVGASWTYATDYLGDKGEMTVTILGEKDGYFIDDKKSELRHTPEGLRDRQRYLIRGPIEVGNGWKTVVSASAVEHNRIISVGERCESQAGPFEDCLVVESSVRRDKNMTLHIRWTWARSIGLVKLETEAEVGGRRIPQVRQSLVRYAVGGGKKAVEPPAAADSASEDAPPRWER